jgi:hypothetical protein
MWKIKGKNIENKISYARAWTHALDPSKKGLAHAQAS